MAAFTLFACFLVVLFASLTSGFHVNIPSHLLGKHASQLPPQSQSTATYTRKSIQSVDSKTSTPSVRLGAQTLSGVFATACYFEYINAQGYNLTISSATVEEYLPNFGFMTDYSEYIGTDGSACSPVKSQLLSKQQLYGTITYSGKSALNPNYFNAVWKVLNSTFYFPNLPQIVPLLDQLNAECPCGGRWDPGTTRSVSSAQCSPYTGDVMFCSVVSGAGLFGVYTYLDDLTVQFSNISLTSTEGWANPPGPPSALSLEEGGDINPSDCDYVRWASCGTSLTWAASNCATCTGLECDGCLSRALQAYSQVVDPWSFCCPCMYYYADSYKGAGWMEVDC